MKKLFTILTVLLTLTVKAQFNCVTSDSLLVVTANIHHPFPGQTVNLTATAGFDEYSWGYNYFYFDTISTSNQIQYIENNSWYSFYGFSVIGFDSTTGHCSYGNANVYDALYCDTTDTLLQVTSSPVYPCNGTTFTLTAQNQANNFYHWSNYNSNLDTITSVNQFQANTWTTYQVTRIDTNTLHCSTGQIQITSINGTEITTDYACGIHVDANNHNVVSFEKNQSNISGYSLFRNDGWGVNDNILVGHITSTQYSEITDTTVDARARSYSYNLLAEDMTGCLLGYGGNTSLTTIYLQANIGQFNVINLLWSEIYGQYFTSDKYYIYRGADTASMAVLDSVPMWNVYNTTNMFTDVNAPNGTVYYQIRVINELGCTPTLKTPTQSTYSTSNMTKCDPYVFLYIKEGKIFASDNGVKILNVYDMLGNMVNNNALSQGMYFVKTTFQNKETVQKVIALGQF